MSTATAPKQANELKLPPEEKFWKRYSPHGEAPLSIIGSFALHALGVGGLMLFGIYLASLFIQPTRSLPVEPVRLALDKLPGGGGQRGGSVDGRGPGVAGGAENIGDDPEALPPELAQEPKRPSLNNAEKAQILEKFDTDSSRFIQESSSDSAKAFARLSDGVRKKLALGNPGQGQGGSGSGGGMGTGTGEGTGPGSGAGKATLGKRERRMLRWHMRFTAASGPEYLAQLRGLGAILAFPVKEDGPEPVFQVVRDLRPGATLLSEDVARLNRIYWIDDKPASVRDILAALSIRLPRMPSRFVALMPESLEKKLYDLERGYVERVLRVPFDEDKIDETTFRVVQTPRGYQPELISVSLRQ